jgi:hypothetical protein
MDNAQIVEAIRQARAIVDAAWPDPSDDVMMRAETKETAAIVRAQLMVSVALKLMTPDYEAPDYLQPRCPECQAKTQRCVDCGRLIYPLLHPTSGEVHGSSEGEKGD